MKSSERIAVQEQWSNGECPCICATVSFGMGVDKATVRAVAHWGLAQNVAAYYQVHKIIVICLPRMSPLLVYTH